MISSSMQKADLEVDKDYLKEECNRLLTNDVEWENENEHLKKEIQKLNEMYAAKCLASEAIVSSLEEELLQEEQLREKETGKLQSKVTFN